MYSVYKNKRKKKKRENGMREGQRENALIVVMVWNVCVGFHYRLCLTAFAIPLRFECECECVRVETRFFHFNRISNSRRCLSIRNSTTRLNIRRWKAFKQNQRRATTPTIQCNKLFSLSCQRHQQGHTKKSICNANAIFCLYID